MKVCMEPRYKRVPRGRSRGLKLVHYMYYCHDFFHIPSSSHLAIPNPGRKEETPFCRRDRFNIPMMNYSFLVVRATELSRGRTDANGETIRVPVLPFWLRYSKKTTLQNVNRNYFPIFI
jgi:hypothetical protein